MVAIGTARAGADEGSASTKSPAAMRDRFFFYRGRVALHALLRALKIGAGDEIVLQAFTCPEVVHPILHLGAIPVFCDTEPGGFNLDAQALGRAMTPATRVVIVQHTFGIPADMSAIMSILRDRGVSIVEDCCHVCASEYGGLPLGSFGDAAFYSYGWEKPISVGLGGEAVVNSPALAEKLQSLYRTYEPPPFSQEVSIAFKALVQTIVPRRALAGLLRVLRRGDLRNSSDRIGRPWSERESRERMPRVLKPRMEHLSAGFQRIASSKRLTIQRLEDGLGPLGIPSARIPERCAALLWRYPLSVRDKPKLLEEAARGGVEIVDWGRAPFRWPGHSGPKDGHYARSCPAAGELSAHVVTIPIHSGLSEARIEELIRFLTRMKAEAVA